MTWTRVRSRAGVVVLVGTVLLGACSASGVREGVASAPEVRRESAGDWKYLDPATVKAADLLPRPSAAADATAFEGALTVAVGGAASPGLRRAAEQANADSACDLVAVLDPSVARHGNPKAMLTGVEAKYPRTYALLTNANADSEEMKKSAKAEFKRPRPIASGHKSADTYPSGHATRAALQATLLAAVAPAKERELLAEAWFLGLCRVTLGVHYPTDVTAGFVFGESIGRMMLEGGNDRFKEDIKNAKAEWPQMQGVGGGR